MVSFPKISPNLLLGVLGIAAAVLLVSQVRKAGADVVGALPTIDEGLRQSISDIASSVATTTQAVAGVTSTVSGIQESFSSGFKSITDFFSGAPTVPLVGVPLTDITAQAPTQPTQIDIDLAAGLPITPTGFDPQADPTRFLPPVGEPQFTGLEEDRPIVQGPIQPIPEERPTTLTELVQSFMAPPIVQPVAPVISELPTEQVFLGGGTGFIGGTIRENPIDTLSEVLNFFPELTASQAADFLAETEGKILPSQVELVDPDIRNIVAAGGDIPFGTQIEVSQAPQDILSIRESENIKAAEFTCREFGLNCDLVDGMMA